MSGYLRLVGLVLSLVGVMASPAQATKRVALVIGNDDYPKLPAEAQLKKAVNDARAMAGKLGELGYSVTAGENADVRQFYALWEEFSAAVAPGDEVAIFFSGHGVEIKGQNFLVPVDAVPPNAGEQTAFRKQLIDLGELAEVLKDERQPRVALFIIDACRNNPFRSADGTRAFGGAKGLAMVEPPKGTFMMFSAGSGELALDRLSDTDPDPNSIYTRNLLPLLGQKGLTIQDVAQKVRAEVSALARAARNHDQNPGYRDELLGERGPLCLAGCDGEVEVPTAVEPQTPLSEAAAAWAEVKDSGNRGMLEAIVKRFPGSVFADFAAAKLRELEPQVAVVAPPPAPADPSGCDALLVKVGTGEECLKPGDVFRDLDVAPEMVVVPAGTFTMGSPANEADRSSDEGPQHDVTIAKPFAVGKFEVTFAEWDACADDGGCTSNSHPDDRGWGRDRQPVINVSWDDAKEYVSWLSKKTEREYRLLSEAEWEYAARAGTTTPFSTGLTITTDQANFNGNETYGGSVAGQYRKKTIAVGSFNPNAFGLHDMHGNVLEWVEDCYADNYNGAPSNGEASATGDCSHRVLRGGSWYNYPWYLRAAVRSRNSTFVPNYDYGFRLGRTLTP